MLNYSRGPVNYPSNEKLFTKFTSKNNWISNEMLPYYAAPLSTGFKDPNPKLNGLTGKFINNFAVYKPSCNN